MLLVPDKILVLSRGHLLSSAPHYEQASFGGRGRVPPMTSPFPSPLSLMQKRIAAHYLHDGRGRIQSINQWDGGTAPRFYLGRTAAGNLWRFRADLPDELVAELQALCAEEPAVNELTRPLKYHNLYLHLLASHTPTKQIWAGPAYWFAVDAIPKIQPISINEENAGLLRGGLEAWLPDVPHRQPFMAIVADGQAVAVCASVRITNAAHEAGVETLPAYRQRGYAVSAVAAWAAAVRKTGALPFYSTSWDNIASQKVAASLGLSLLGMDFHMT